MTLVGLGFRALSMPPASVGPVKAMLLALDVAPLTAFLDEALRCDGQLETLRPRLEAFAEANCIPV